MVVHATRLLIPLLDKYLRIRRPVILSGIWRVLLSADAVFLRLFVALGLGRLNISDPIARR